MVTREGPEPSRGTLGRGARLRASGGIQLGSDRLSGGLRASLAWKLTVVVIITIIQRTYSIENAAGPALSIL